MQTIIRREPVSGPDFRVVGYDLELVPVPLEEEGSPAVDLLRDPVRNAWTRGDLVMVPVTAAALASPGLEALDPARTVLMLDGNLQTSRTLARCRELRRSGFRIGLERALFPAAGDEVLAMATLVRVNVAANPGPALEAQVRALRRDGVTLLADGVPDRAGRERCAALGFQLFRGWTREPASGCEGPEAEGASVLRVLAAALDPQVDAARLGAVIRAEQGLEDRLLRLLGTIAPRVTGCTSGEEVLRSVGREALARGLALLLLRPEPAGSLAAELNLAALLHGRVCERLAAETARPAETGRLFAAGLVARLGAAGRRAGTAAAAGATLLRPGVLPPGDRDGALLGLVDACGRGAGREIARHCLALDVPPARVTEIFSEGLDWAHRAVSPLSLVVPATGVAPLPRSRTRLPAR